MAIKIEDGDGYERGTWAATVEVLVQAGALDGPAIRMLARYHRPPRVDPHGRVGAEAIPASSSPPRRAGPRLTPPRSVADRAFTGSLRSVG